MTLAVLEGRGADAVSLELWTAVGVESCRFDAMVVGCVVSAVAEVVTNSDEACVVAVEATLLSD